MKGLYFFAILLLIALPLFQVQNKNLVSICEASEVYFVKQKGGKQYYEKQEKKDFYVNDFTKTEGVMLKFSKDKKQEIMENFNVKVIKKEQIDGLNIIYGYTDFYSNFIYIKGKQSNVQIAESDDCVIVGFPIIYSGY